MPSVTVHLRLAECVLDHWRTRRDSAPFEPDDDGAVNAFRQGAVGPDLGYMPGGVRVLSDLAHTFRSGDLARALIHSADTTLERAFAWGWVTHVLADTLIHPLVGCAAGEMIHGSPSRFVSGDEDQVTHVRVEVGLDAIYADRHAELRRLRLRDVFDANSIGFVVGAYASTYGAVLDAVDFLRSHRLSARRTMQGLGFAAVAALLMPPSPMRQGEVAGPLGRVRSVVARQNIGLAFLLPAPPSLWFLNAVRDVEESFVELFLEEFEMGGLGLANVNLDSGRPDLSEVGSGGLRRALDHLSALGAEIPALRPALSGIA